MADTHGSGPCARKGVEVQVLSPAPYFTRIQAASAIDGRGLFLFVGAARPPNGACGRTRPPVNIGVDFGFEYYYNVQVPGSGGVGYG